MARRGRADAARLFVCRRVRAEHRRQDARRCGPCRHRDLERWGRALGDGRYDRVQRGRLRRRRGCWVGRRRSRPDREVGRSRGPVDPGAKTVDSTRKTPETSMDDRESVATHKRLLIAPLAFAAIAACRHPTTTASSMGPATSPPPSTGRGGATVGLATAAPRPRPPRLSPDSLGKLRRVLVNQVLATIAGHEKDKGRAKSMIEMTNVINREHMPKLNAQKPEVVTCMLCHRGTNDPRDTVETYRAVKPPGG